MKFKYEKPIARDLGEILPDAEGYCQSGFSATLVSGGQPCITGSVASGGMCDNGILAQPAQGNSPCTSGGTAGSQCTVGTLPYTVV